MNFTLQKNNIFYLGFLCLITLYSCELINPEEKIPVVLEIEKVLVESMVNEEGTNLHAIEDVWVFINPEGEEGSDLLGVFPLPAKIPVLEEGMTEISIQAGVKLNNQNANRSIYPLLKSERKIFDLKSGETIQWNPTLSYKSPAQIRFDFINDFELSNDFVSLSDSIDLELTTDEELVFEGNRSLTLQLDTANTGFIIATISSFPVQRNRNNIDEELPIGDRNTYMEMHYKNDATLFVSIFVNRDPLPTNILRLGAKTEWSKIYIPLKDILATANATSDENNIDEPFISLAFEGFKPDSLSTARFSWDNIKIVHELI